MSVRVEAKHVLACAQTTQGVQAHGRNHSPRCVGQEARRPPHPQAFLQIAIAVGLTAAVFLVVIVGNGLVVGRQASLQAGLNVWLAFIKRPDILATMILTAFVTVIFVYWQRNQERKAGGSSRMQS